MCSLSNLLKQLIRDYQLRLLKELVSFSHVSVREKSNHSVWWRSKSLKRVLTRLLFFEIKMFNFYNRKMKLGNLVHQDNSWGRYRFQTRCQNVQNKTLFDFSNYFIVSSEFSECKFRINLT